MTLEASSKDADPFWMRVRTALSALRPDRERKPAYGQAAIARSIGMKPRLGNRIDEELIFGWRAAATRNVSLSLIVVEIDRSADYFNAYGKTAMDDCAHEVMQTITGLLPRPSDSCLRLGRSSYVLVLPDLPVLMARSLASKVNDAVRGLSLVHKESHAGIVTVSQGLAVSNPRGDYDRRFFETAADALKKAQRKGLGQVTAVDLRPAQERKRRKAA